MQATLALLGKPSTDVPPAPRAALASWVRDHGAALASQLTGTNQDEIELAA
ncbi:hypothetical protein ACFQFR_03150 [Streptomyces goshikiensis]